MQIKEFEDKLDPLKEQLNMKMREKDKLKNEYLKNTEEMIIRLDNLKKIDYEIQR